MQVDPHPLDLTRQQTLLDEALESMSAQVAVISPEGTVVYLSRLWRSTQRAHHALIDLSLGASVSEHGVVSHEALVPGLRDALDAVWNRRLRHYTRQISLEHLGRPMWVTLEVHRLATGDVMILLRDVTASAVREQQLERRATHDGLTDLPNRALIVEALAEALERVTRGRMNLGVIICDIDGFKHVNDSLGHLAGDELLIQVAERWSEAVRPEDLLGRLGGDEFVVIAADVHDERELQMIALRLQQALASRIACTRGTAKVSACIGAVLVASGTHRIPVTRVLERADAALYAAKREGAEQIRIARINHRQ